MTRRLHVPHEVWSQGGAKLANVGEKVRVVAILCSALEDLQTSSSEHFGAGNVSSGLALGIGSIGRKEADAWLTQLDNFSSICDGVVTDFGKKLGVGEGFVPKKARWQTIARGFDKFTNGKKYVCHFHYYSTPLTDHAIVSTLQQHMSGALKSCFYMHSFSTNIRELFCPNQPHQHILRFLQIFAPLSNRN